MSFAEMISYSGMWQAVGMMWPGTYAEFHSGIYMADSFYAKWTKLFDSDNKTAWDDILTQFVIYESHTRK